jgi:hypothetical protein
VAVVVAIGAAEEAAISAAAGAAAIGNQGPLRRQAYGVRVHDDVRLRETIA